MSKKKRKTRIEKEVSPKYNFSAPVYRVESDKKSENKEKETGEKNVKNIPAIRDLKKVGILIVITLLAIGVFAYMVYSTEMFVVILQKLNIKY